MQCHSVCQSPPEMYPSRAEEVYNERNAFGLMQSISTKIIRTKKAVRWPRWRNRVLTLLQIDPSGRCQWTLISCSSSSFVNNIGRCQNHYKRFRKLYGIHTDYRSKTTRQHTHFHPSRQLQPWKILKCWNTTSPVLGSADHRSHWEHHCL